VEGVAAERLGHEDEAQGTESCKEISTRNWDRISSAVSRSLRASVRSRFQRVPKTVASVPVSPIRATHISVGSMDWPCQHWLGPDATGLARLQWVGGLAAVEGTLDFEDHGLPRRVVEEVLLEDVNDAVAASEADQEDVVHRLLGGVGEDVIALRLYPNGNPAPGGGGRLDEEVHDLTATRGPAPVLGALVGPQPRPANEAGRGGAGVVGIAGDLGERPVDHPLGPGVRICQEPRRRLAGAVEPAKPLGHLVELRALGHDGEGAQTRGAGLGAPGAELAEGLPLAHGVITVAVSTPDSIVIQ